MKPSQPFLKKLRRQVARGAVEGIRESLQSLPVPQRQEVGLRAARWAIGDGAAHSLRECLAKEHGVDPNGFLDLMVPSLVHVVGEVSWGWKQDRGDLETVVPALLTVLVEAHGGSLPSYKTVESPLVKAAQQDDLVYARALLDAGVDPDGEYRWKEGNRGGHGFTPLHCARSLEMVGLLLAGGASLSAAPAGAALGGMAGVVLKWQHETDLPALIQVWLDHGGNLSEPMEGHGEPVSLLDYIFRAVWEQKVSATSSDAPVWQSRRQRAHLLQTLLIGNGWVDLNHTDAQGVSWREWVDRYGSSPLQKKLALEEATAAPSKANRIRL